MNKSVSKQARFDAAFAEFAEIIRKEQHNDASIFRMISEMIPYQPLVATAFAANVAWVLDQIESEVNYVEVVVEAWRLTLFATEEEVAAGRQYLDAFQGNPAKAEQLAHEARHYSSYGAIVYNTNLSVH